MTKQTSKEKELREILKGLSCYNFLDMDKNREGFLVIRTGKQILKWHAKHSQERVEKCQNCGANVLKKCWKCKDELWFMPEAKLKQEKK